MTEFAPFAEQHLPRLRSYVARIPGARQAEIEDLLQEALIRAYEARDRFESDEHAINWICQVVRNLLIDHRRRWLRRPILPHANLDDVSGRAPDPADVVVAAEQTDLAVRALTRLSQAQRELLWEHVVDGVSYADIARRTATPLATVRSLAHRAKLAAAREFAAVGGALSGVPTLALRPWRRLANKAVGVPQATIDALAMVGAVVVAIATPMGALPGAVASPQPVVTTLASGPHGTSAGVGGDRHPPGPADTTTEHQPGSAAPTAAPPRPAFAPDPTQLIQSVQSGGFSGTYSGDCALNHGFGVRIPDNYTCRFTATSQVCQIKLRGSTTTTGCVVDLISSQVTGISIGYNARGVDVPVYNCATEGSGTGTVRFRTSATAPAVDIPVSLFMNEAAVVFTGHGAGKLSLSASFPYAACTPARSLVQVGLQGTFGSSATSQQPRR